MYSNHDNSSFHVESMVIPYGIHMESMWNGIRKMSGIPAKTYSIWNGWNPPRITWNPHGIHMESIWNPYGIWGQGKDLASMATAFHIWNPLPLPIPCYFVNAH